MTTKIINVTLAELHDWIVTARELQLTDDGEGRKIRLIGDPDDNDESLKIVEAAINKLMPKIDALDCLFHDHFDCR